MPERPGYLLDKDAQRRAGVTFNQRDDVRDLMKSPAGQNYGNMMDLQNQSIRQGGFESGDPRVDELKQARRQYNRQDKYNIANTQVQHTRKCALFLIWRTELRGQGDLRDCF